MINPAQNYLLDTGYIRRLNPPLMTAKDPEKVAELYQNFLIRVKMTRLLAPLNVDFV
jgi:hypothetical protein